MDKDPFTVEKETVIFNIHSLHSTAHLYCFLLKLGWTTKWVKMSSFTTPFHVDWDKLRTGCWCWSVYLCQQELVQYRHNREQNLPTWHWIPRSLFYLPCELHQLVIMVAESEVEHGTLYWTEGKLMYRSRDADAQVCRWINGRREEVTPPSSAQTQIKMHRETERHTRNTRVTKHRKQQGIWEAKLPTPDTAFYIVVHIHPKAIFPDYPKFILEDFNHCSMATTNIWPVPHTCRQSKKCLMAQ